MTVSVGKIPVTGLMGGGGALGVVPPKLWMTTNQGVITEISSDGTLVTVSGTNTSIMTKYHPYQLFVTLANASGVDSVAYPTGAGNYAFSHAGQTDSTSSPSGYYYSKGGPPIGVYDGRFDF